MPEIGSMGTRAMGKMRNYWRKVVVTAERARAVVTVAVVSAIVGGQVTSAQAQQNLGDVADRLAALGSNIYNLLGVVAALGGTGLALTGLYKCYHARQNPNDPSAKVSTGVLMLFIGGAMVALPEVLGVGVSSLFGTGAETLQIGDDLEGLR